MHIAEMILGCLLVGQTPDALLQAPTSAEKRAPAVLEPTIRAGSASDVVPASASNQTVASRIRPPEMVAAALVLPAGSTLTGQPLTLFSVLSSTADRRQQLELTRAYWHLVQAVAGYRFCLDHAQQIERAKPASNEPAELRLARASTAAMLLQAESEAVGSQYELARLMRLPPGAPLPLPADRPHVGPYRTNFQEMFAGRTAPEPAALMDRVLPIRHQAANDRAAAVQAAEDVLAAVTDGQQTGRSDATAAIACSQVLLQQRRAFMHSVCDYNRSIAEYGLAVASPTANPQALVAILIGPAQQGITPVIVDEGRPAQPAGADVPITARANTWRSAEPTPAPPRDSLSRPPSPVARPQEPTLAPPRDSGQRMGQNEPAATPRRDDVQPVSAEEPMSPVTGQEPGGQSTPPVQGAHVPTEDLSVPSSSGQQPRTANKPSLATSPAAAGTSLLYPALSDAAPGVRAKQLTVALHWDRSLPEGIGKPMSLAECLLRDPGADRRATIEAYWRVRQRAAEYQALVEQGALFDGLDALVLERRQERSGPTDMLRLRLARLAAQASIREAHAALIEAQYVLAQRIGARGDSAWPLASTVPHWGTYLLKLEAQPKAVVESWPIRRLATTIPMLCDSVQQHAAAIVEADAARVSAIEKYRSGGSIDQLIDSVTVQTQQTLQILATLTDYNTAIAEYVLTVLPPATPASRLVSALVLNP